MGGVFSNHLHALAFVTHNLQIPFYAFTYGLREGVDSWILKDIRKWGGILIPLARDHARSLRTAHFYKSAGGLNIYWIPEGGGGGAASFGIGAMVKEFPLGFDRAENVLLAPCGSGTSIKYFLEHTQGIQVCSLKIVAKAYYEFEDNPRFHWLSGFEKRSFSSLRKQAMDFGREISRNCGIFFDPVYAGPLLYALCHNASQIEKKFQDIYFWHTGGVQWKGNDYRPH